MLKKYLRQSLPFYDDGDGSGSGADPGKQGQAAEPKKPEISQEKYQEIFNSGFKQATGKYKSQLDEKEKELQELKEFKELKAREAAEAEEKDLEKKKEFDTIKQNLIKNHTDEKTKLNNKIGSLENEIRSLVVDTKLMEVALDPELKIIPEMIPDFIYVVSRNVSFEKIEDNGKSEYKVFPSINGAPMVNTQNGEELTLKKYFEQILETKPGYRQPLANPGSGGKGSGHQSNKSGPTTSREAIHLGRELLKKQ